MVDPYSDGPKPAVLVVDDEQTVADLYAEQLTETYDVQTAYSGEEALEAIGSHVDVVLLDRHMPGVSGDEVLEEIRSRELDCRVIMLTGVKPDIDIIDLPFDEYLVKPVNRESVHDAIERMLVRKTHDAKLQEFLAVVSKLATLESKLELSELLASDAYTTLEARFTDLRRELEEETPDDMYTEFTTEKICSLTG